MDKSTALKAACVMTAENITLMVAAYLEEDPDATGARIVSLVGNFSANLRKEYGL